jgi:hypothetical protein
VLYQQRVKGVELGPALELLELALTERSLNQVDPDVVLNPRADVATPLGDS